MMGDGERFRDHDRREPPGCDDCRDVAEFFDDSIDEAIDLAGETVERPRLERLDRVLSDDGSGTDQFDLAELRSTLTK